MATEIICRREGNHLVPVTGSDAESLMAVAFDKDLKVRITRDRSLPHHRLYWKLLERVAAGVGRFSSEGLHETVKFALGHVRAFQPFHGPMQLVPDSTSFDKMGQDEFNRFFDAAVQLLDEQFAGAASAVLEDMGKAA